LSRKIHLITLGCFKNTVDSEVIAGGLTRAQFELVAEPEQADTIIINTCGFINDAKQESIDTILEAAKLKESAGVKQLIVTGCLSQRYHDELKQALPEVDEFFGAEDFQNLLHYLTGKPYLRDDPRHWRRLLTPPHYAYLKIAEGCDNACTFCAIPLMRGGQRSRTIPDLLDEAQRLSETGVQELIVIAQDTTSYGWDLKPKRYLYELLEELEQLPGLPWMRLLYAHPAHFSRRLIPVYQQAAKLVPYLDIPIQHAADRLLKAMQRGLGQDGIRRLLNEIREAVPEIRLRTSVIVGFPGETVEEFQELLKFLEEMAFDRLGVFTYSEEEGTTAAELEDDVPREEKLNRMDEVMALQESISLEKNEAMVGQTIEVLVDKPDPEKPGWWLGRTPWDAPEIDQVVHLQGNTSPGSFCKVRITAAEAFSLTGEILDEENNG